MFHSFEHFVILNTEEELNMSGQADAPHNFDKISFLSEQVFFVQFRRFFSTLWSGSGLNFFFDPIRILVIFGQMIFISSVADPDWDCLCLWIRIGMLFKTFGSGSWIWQGFLSICLVELGNRMIFSAPCSGSGLYLFSLWIWILFFFVKISFNSGLEQVGGFSWLLRIRIFSGPLFWIRFFKT